MNFWHEFITLGSLKIPRFIGGPLDGITDSPFRTLVRELSPQPLLFTEMRHVACVANDKTGRLSLNFAQSERPLNYQVTACDVNFIEQACQKILAHGVDAIDMNIGCPAPAVTRSGAGSALMADLPRLKRVITALRAAVPIPLTVKMRAGFKEKNALVVAQMMQDLGVDAITVHPRLKTQMFSGRPDYELVAQIKKAVSIPVFLSGNIINFKTAQLAYEQTGADGYLIGRGMWSKPWKLHEMAEHAAARPYSLSVVQVLDYAHKHYCAMIAHYQRQGLYCFRKHLPFYLKGLPGASALRQELVTINCPDIMNEKLLALQRMACEQ